MVLNFLNFLIQISRKNHYLESFFCYVNTSKHDPFRLYCICHEHVIRKSLYFGQEQSLLQPFPHSLLPQVQDFHTFYLFILVFSKMYYRNTDQVQFPDIYCLPQLSVFRYATLLFKKQRYVSGQHKVNLKIICKENYKYEVQEKSPANQAVTVQQLAEEYWR